jgi:hypothetical protein
MEIYEFEIPSHTTRREWAVYVIIARNRNGAKKILYVGKVGDNRDGCNPIISRIGNHFSHNKIHSQIRNKIPATTEYDYKILYSTFGEYVQNQLNFKDKVNELERQLNIYIQQNVEKLENVEFLNPYKGIGVSKSKQKERSELLTEIEKNALKKLANKATE